jgi:imidazolonepropionase
MGGIVYRKISCLITNKGVIAKRGVRPLENDLGIISQAALVTNAKGKVLWVGKDSALPKQFKDRAWKTKNGKGYVAYPGLVDSHTHPVFSGDRSLEFELRMRGASYQQIADAGGGIVTSVAATRSASKKDLLLKLEGRLKTSYGFGVRLQEAKSGYGLSLKSEIQSLEAIREAKSKVRLVATCMAAHAIPKEKRTNRSEYLEEILKIYEMVAKKKLARYVDVFCDQGYFSLEETLHFLEAGKKLGLPARVHGEELVLTGIAKAAAEFGAHSVDHLLKVDDAGIQALAKSGTVATLLPGTGFYLREPPAPARKLIDQGAVVALASDFNPGSCPTQNLPFIGSLGAIVLGMSTAEIIASLTWNAARSLREENSFGALLPGFEGTPAFCEGDHPSALFYRLAPASLPEPPTFAT